MSSQLGFLCRHTSAQSGKSDHKVESRIFNLRLDKWSSARVSSECRNTRCSVCLKARPITTDLVDSSPAGRYPAQFKSHAAPLGGFTGPLVQSGTTEIRR